MTIPPDVEARFDEAHANWRQAVNNMIAALDERVIAMARDAYPDAHTLHVLGEPAENGFIVRAQKITDADGNTIAGFDDDGMSDDEDWDNFTDEVDPYLDWLGELAEDDYLGDQKIELR